ncbi:MAG TPA: cell division protein FtsK [Streptosporangiaceae bacterium]
MSTDPASGHPNPSDTPLPAIPAAEVEEPPTGPAAYADVTAPRERKPILPPWLTSREAMAHHARRAGGYAWHSARYHGLRSPVYLGAVLFWAPVGAARLTGRWLRWWLSPIPVAVYADAVNDGHRAWHRTHTEHKRTTRTRAWVTAWVLLAAALIVSAVELFAPWWAWVPLAGAAVLLLARHGRPEGKRIVQPAVVPPAYEVLTQDVITRALGSLGLAGINSWLREGREIDYTGPCRQDGPGWRAEMNLPYGTTAAQIIDRRAQLASGLRRPLGAVWPEAVPTEHEGRLELWVGREDVSKRKPAPWPLAKGGAVDIFQPVPFAADMRVRPVRAPLIFHNWLIGSQPRNGKTAAVRVLACAAALDPLAELWIHELKGTGDLDPLECVSHRFVSGIDDDSIGEAAESLRLLRAEVERRSPRVKALPPEVCPEKRVTRQIAAKRSLRLWPVVCVIDECQNLFAHPKFGKQAGADAEWVIKLGPALGIVLILATQRPDKDSLPTGVSGNVSLRFCLYVAGQVETDMILGTSAYKNGLRPTTFRPEVDAGLGYLKGATPAPKVVRTYFLDVPAAKAVAVRARAARERAGTLTGVAAGQDAGEAARDVLGDALAVFGTSPALHWGALAERLAGRYPDRWADVTADAISAQMRSLGVPSVQVKAAGENRQGCRRDTIEALPR